jgi:hypothetical protein
VGLEGWEMATRLKRSKRKRKMSEATRIIRIAARVQKPNLRRLDRAQAGGEVIKRSLMFSRLAKNRSSVREHIHRLRYRANLERFKNNG